MGKKNFAAASEVGRELFGEVDGFLDHFFEGGQFDRLGKAVGDGEFIEGAFVGEDDFIFFDTHVVAIGEGEFIEFGFGDWFFFKFFDGGKDLFFFFFSETPEDDGAIGEIKNISFNVSLFAGLKVDDIAEELGGAHALEEEVKAGDVVTCGCAIGGATHSGPWIKSLIPDIERKSLAIFSGFVLRWRSLSSARVAELADALP